MENNRSPLDGIDISFANYVRRRKASEAGHLINGIPDYAYSLDCDIREKIMAIPHFYSVARKMMSAAVADDIAQLTRKSIQVGPNQYADLYEMGVECAKRLGISIPNIYVYNNRTMNAYTLGADNVSPIICIYSGLLEGMKPEEVKTVIAHECGHIHNNHVALTCFSNMLTSTFASSLGIIASAANIALINTWNRAAEVTADRAGLICADRPEDVITADAKLLSGPGQEREINLDALYRQYQEIAGNPASIAELVANHPSTVRRIFAEKEFTECEIYYKWRPELKQPGVVTRSKKETDERCNKIIGIINK